MRRIGYITLVGAVALMHVSVIQDQVLMAGFADPSLWTNHVGAIGVGLNRYLNCYNMIYLDWQHSSSGNPIRTWSSDRFTSTTDLFWLRFQV